MSILQQKISNQKKLFLYIQPMLGIKTITLQILLAHMKDELVEWVTEVSINQRILYETPLHKNTLFSYCLQPCVQFIGKWVCDPHRIRAYSEARRTQGGNGCLVYSIGSAGNFEFETGLQKAFRVGDDAYQNSCEVHVFDIEDFSGETPEGLFFHNWGLESSTDPRTAQGDQRQAENEPVFKSFQETVANLGKSLLRTLIGTARLDSNLTPICIPYMLSLMLLI